MVAKRSSAKLNTEMFDEVPVLQRKWQAAVRPGEELPRYEDVMLGSLGRIADHIVLLKNNCEAIEVSRTGRYIQHYGYSRAEGCNQVQGFLFSAAKSAREIAQLLYRFGVRGTRAA